MGFWCELTGHKWKTTYRKTIETKIYTIQKCSRCSCERGQSHESWPSSRYEVDLDWLKAHITLQDEVDN